MFYRSHDVVAVAKHKKQREYQDEQRDKETQQIFDQCSEFAGQEGRDFLRGLPQGLGKIGRLPCLRKLRAHPRYHFGGQFAFRIHERGLQSCGGINGLFGGVRQHYQGWYDEQHRHSNGAQHGRVVGLETLRQPFMHRVEKYRQDRRPSQGHQKRLEDQIHHVPEQQQRSIRKYVCEAIAGGGHRVGDSLHAGSILPQFGGNWLLDADLLDQSQNILMSYVVYRAHIFLFQALSQVVRGDKASLAIGQVASATIAKFYECRVRQTDHHDVAVNKKLGIDRVAVARGDAVPQVRKAAFIAVPGQLGSDLEGAYKLFHG